MIHQSKLLFKNLEATEAQVEKEQKKLPQLLLLRYSSLTLDYKRMSLVVILLEWLVLVKILIKWERYLLVLLRTLLLDFNMLLRMECINTVPNPVWTCLILV